MDGCSLRSKNPRQWPQIWTLTTGNSPVHPLVFAKEVLHCRRPIFANSCSILRAKINKIEGKKLYMSAIVQDAHTKAIQAESTTLFIFMNWQITPFFMRVKAYLVCSNVQYCITCRNAIAITVWFTMFQGIEITLNSCINVDLQNLAANILFQSNSQFSFWYSAKHK